MEALPESPERSRHPRKVPRLCPAYLDCARSHERRIECLPAPCGIATPAVSPWRLERHSQSPPCQSVREANVSVARRFTPRCGERTSNVLYVARPCVSSRPRSPQSSRRSACGNRGASPPPSLPGRCASRRQRARTPSERVNSSQASRGSLGIRPVKGRCPPVSQSPGG